MAISRNQLLRSAEALCTDFASKRDIHTLLGHFSTTRQCTAIEHGEPFLALGRPFVGLEGIQEYFELIGTLIAYEDMRFSEFVVDAEVRKVTVKGRAKFTCKNTGESWDETFAYSLDFDDELKL